MKKLIYHNELDDLTDCPVCNTIYNLLKLKGASYRDELLNYIEIPRTTLYDHLNHLMNRKLVKSYSVSVSKRGRPMTMFFVDGYKPDNIVLHKYQKGLIEDINKYGLYINLWGRLTGKTTTATLASIKSGEPTLIIGRDKKAAKKILYYHLSHWSKLLPNAFKGYRGFVASQEDYLKRYFIARDVLGQETMMTIILDNVYPNGDKVIDTLIKEDNVRLVIFATPELMKKDREKSIRLNNYIEDLYNGYYDFGKTVFMNTSFVPTEPKKLGKKEVGVIKSNLPEDKFITEFTCNFNFVRRIEEAIL